jgi:hypothetical protein
MIYQSWIYLMFLSLLISCAKKKETLKADITKINAEFFEDSTSLGHHEFPGLQFSISIVNNSDREEVIYVQDYGRKVVSNSGSFWIYYNSEFDSLQLFSGSCEYCSDSVVLKSRGSVKLILQTEYSDLFSSSRLESRGDIGDFVDQELKGIYEGWINSKGTMIFDIDGASTRAKLKHLNQ